MAQFKRRNNALNLDFDGVHFTVDPTKKEFLTAVNNFKQKADELQSLSDTENFISSADKVTAELAGCIDEMLGKDATKKIFGDESISMFDCMDVINYILDSMHEFNAEISQKYNISRIKR